MQHVLIMEDNALLGFEWKEAFELNHYRVTLVHTGAEAIDLLASEKFDIVVTDLFVHNSKGGLSVIFSAEQIGKDAPLIIAVTGVADQPGKSSPQNLFLEQAKILGASAVLQKPFSSSELIALVQSKTQTK